jgi:hypothetical protein
VNSSGAVVGIVLDSHPAEGMANDRIVPLSAVARNWPPLVELLAGTWSLPSEPIPTSAFFELVDAVEQVPCILDEDTRTLVVRQLPPAISGAIRHHPQRRAHVLSIVRTCLDYDGGIVELFTILRAMERDGSEPLRRLGEVAERLFRV